MSFTAGADVAPVNLNSYFNDPNATTDFAMFDTSLGTIPVLLTPSTTPKTVTNFLNYVNKGSYTNTVVHRSVPGFIWQAGGYQLSSSSQLATIPADAAVPNEFGASNVRGTIAMAKLGSD
ncbi:peptidylprolyl isomerase, partial [Singulisphaera rosea]